MPRFRIHLQNASEFEDVLAWYAGLSPLAAENLAIGFHLALVKADAGHADATQEGILSENLVAGSACLALW